MSAENTFKVVERMRANKIPQVGVVKCQIRCGQMNSQPKVLMASAEVYIHGMYLNLAYFAHTILSDIYIYFVFVCIGDI